MIWSCVRPVCLLAVSGAIASVISRVSPVQAQLIPDAILGTERSQVIPNVLINGELSDRIDGGAVRANNLFHSFSEFNINNSQRVYFSNPVTIDHIFSRVTGTNGTEILGTLGVLGDADLYLINPNGILFGTDAQLDVRGSFVSSTAHSLGIDSGYIFSTLNPDVPPLLLVNFNPGLDHWLPTTGTLTNQGNLSVDQNLTLIAHQLKIQGSLNTGGDLVLHGTDTLTVSDQAHSPLVITAGNNLTLQGNQTLEINALDAPNSGLFSRGNIRLRSDGPILVDTRFTSGGHFRAEQLDGRLGDAISPHDPVFEVSGNFELANFTGSSLQVLAGGRVNIPGAITINAAGGIFNDSTVTLSDGTVLPIRGTAEPTVDIRAGTEGFFGTPGTGASVATTADINLGNITTTGGLVFLTNQFQPNAGLSTDAFANITVGAINTADQGGGGSVVIDSRGTITPNTLINVSGGDLFNTFTFNGTGGDVRLLADGDITLPFRTDIVSFGTVGGNITLKSNSAITQDNAFEGATFNQVSNIESNTMGMGTGGNISLMAPTIFLGGNVQNNLFPGGQGKTGDISITATDSLTTNQSTIATATFADGDSGNIFIDTDALTLNFSFLGTVTGSPSGGSAGNIDIDTRSLVGTNGGQVSSVAGDFFGFGAVIGNTGNITVDATDSISVTGLGPDNFTISGFGNSISAGATGNGGRITLRTGSLAINGGAQVRATTEGQGNAGRVEIIASESVTVDGAVLGAPGSIPSAILSEVVPGAVGQGSEIVITTGRLSVANGGFISASTNADGPSGNVTITATTSASFDGAPGGDFDPSGAFVGTLENATGNGGNLTITAPILSVTNGARLEAETRGVGNAGNINLNVTEELRLDQGLISAEAANVDGGDITLNLGPLLLLRNGSNISATAGRALGFGNGGNITITMPEGFVVAVDTENSDITANAFRGNGGNVNVVTQGLFGIEFRPALTPLSDITASSDFGLQGEVTIETPDIDPSDDLVELPTGLVDASRLVAQGCGTDNRSTASALGEFTVTGRGGVPLSPENMNVQNDLAVWETLEADSETGVVGHTSIPEGLQQLSPQPTQIVEFQNWMVGDDGEIILTAATTTPVPHTPWQTAITCQTNVS